MEKYKIGTLCLIGVLLFLNYCAASYPEPPKMPKSFNNSDDLLKYLQKLHVYYVVVGRPR